MIEMKVGLVKEEGQIIGAFVMVVPDNGIPIMLGKIFGAISILLIPFIALPIGIRNDLALGLKVVGGILLGFGGGMTLFCSLCWLLVNLGRGVYRTVEYTMGEAKITGTAAPKKQERAENAAFLLALFCLFAGARDSRRAASVAKPARIEFEYSDIRCIRAGRKHNSIRVNGILQEYLIQTAPHQFDFVYNYIKMHCPEAKIKTK